MQTIQIESKLYQQLMQHGIDIEKELSKLVSNFIQKPSKEEIAKSVENSQRIEGYGAVSKELELEVEAFMKENHIEISA